MNARMGNTMNEFFIFTHATRRLTTKINEIYNSDSAFYAESKYQFRISLIWTYACVIHCERIFIFTHSIMRLANNSMKKRIKNFYLLACGKQLPKKYLIGANDFSPHKFYVIVMGFVLFILVTTYLYLRDYVTYFDWILHLSKYILMELQCIHIVLNPPQFWWNELHQSSCEKSYVHHKLVRR